MIPTRADLAAIRSRSAAEVAGAEVAAVCVMSGTGWSALGVRTGSAGDEDVQDAAGGVPVPQVGGLESGPVRAGGGPGGGDDPVRVHADQDVRPRFYRDRPLGVGPQRQTRNAEERGLLLKPAGVGHDEPG